MATKARAKVRKKKQARKAPRRRQRDERAALLSDLGRRVVKLGKARIDEIRGMYDAAHAEAQIGLARALARSKAQGVKASDVRRRFRDAMESLKSTFVLDAIAESQSVAELQATITETLATVTSEDRVSLAQLEIARAFAAWSEEARARQRARKDRLSDWLAARGLAAPKTRKALRAMLAKAAGAVAIVQADEARLAADAAAQRKLIDDWTRKVRMCRNMGDEALAAEAQERLAQHERTGEELERELASQSAARASLEGQLTELRRSVG